MLNTARRRPQATRQANKRVRAPHSDVDRQRFLLQLARSLLSQVVQRTLTAGPVRVFAVADYGSSVGNNSVVELADVVRAVAAQKVTCTVC